MNARENLEALKIKQAAIAKAILVAKSKLGQSERTADTHVKAAIGGTVIALFETLPSTIRYAILNGADAGIQKEGLGREKFEDLKARFAKSTTGEQK